MKVEQAGGQAQLGRSGVNHADVDRLRVSGAQVAALAAELAQADPSLQMVVGGAELQRLSRDFYDYSPVLVPQLEGCCAQLAVLATSVEQVQLVAGACSRHGVPLTLRGA